MPMTLCWCFSIKRFGSRFAGAELFFSMKPFYSINCILSVHRSTLPHGLATRLRLCRAKDRGASDLPASAVHVDLDTSDVRSILGRKKRYRGRYFLWLPEALHWYFRK